MTKKVRITQFVPEEGLRLTRYKGAQFIDRLGEEVVKETVSSVLCGDNVRSLTEGLTRRRILLSNASLLVTFLKASNNIQNFFDDLPNLVAEELKTSKLIPEKKIYLQWLVGLTGKSFQNVLRSDKEELKIYLNELEEALEESAQSTQDIFGDLTGTVRLGEENLNVDWPNILQVFTAIGAQTLTIRGSEKSLYGKMFERLILGSLLTLLGFKRVDKNISTETNKVFWLSSQEDKRESDATVLVKAGYGVRFDIGFIGPGNTEISLDKVSRFEREMEHGRQTHYMATIIIVDRIGEGSRITDLAKNVNGNIVQMSMSYWVKEIASILNITTGFNHPILQLTNDESLEYIDEEMEKISLQSFIIDPTPI